MMDLIDGLDTRLTKTPNKVVDEGYLSGRNSSVCSRKIVRKNTGTSSVVTEKRSTGRKSDNLSRYTTLLSLGEFERCPTWEEEDKRFIGDSARGTTGEAEKNNENTNDFKHELVSRQKTDTTSGFGVPSLSDSDEYDTDLEVITLKPTDNEDKYVCRSVYQKVCENCGEAPQRTVNRDLGRRCIDLSHRNLGPAGMQPICAALLENLRVETLLLEGMDMKDQGCMYLSNVLLDNLVITRLNLSTNNLGNDAARYLSVALSRSKTLLHLNLSDNRLGDEAVISLSKGLSRNDSLLTLNLSKNIIGEEGAKALGAAMAENCRLNELNASWNFIRGSGAVGICKSFKENTTLHMLYLAWNGLGYEGTVAVSDTLRTNDSLRELDISNNRLDWNCADILAKGLRANADLEVLNIGYNHITTTGAMAILQAVANTRSNLRVLDMMNVSILPESELLAMTIEHRRKFKLIHGGVVRSHDTLGEKKEKPIDAMQRILDYMKTLGLRPVEMIREFDKTANYQISQKDFIARLKSKGIPLHKFEMEDLAKRIAGKNGKSVNYRKLVDSVKNHVVKERNDKIKIRNKKQKREAYHKKLLELRLPSEVLSEPEEDQIGSLVELRSSSAALTQSYSSLHSMLSSQRSMSKLPSLLSRSKDSDFPLKTSRGSSAVSMSGPLSGGTYRTPRKKTQRKKRGNDCFPGVTWTDSGLILCKQ
ncbi:leucine-rich repeat-containing protein 74A-like [Pecten maximus]|uniref:leucine-rich repeat-containing protein 74A-like n=1 Tax=Pecten maximus TaxID=6579 RepID=UPI0014585C43|nr:leucine-rich repeat-containing protein 74A-like [Pecten maximus]